LPIALLELNPWVAGALGGLTVLFAYFGLLTVLRSRTKIRVDDEGIAVIAPWRKRIEWSRLNGVTLNYYATGSRREHGWMHLVLKSGTGRIKVDSRLDGFADVARRAITAARDNRVVPNDVTLANFRSLGIVPTRRDDEDAAEQERVPR
jgi:hypothetical protein